MARESGTRLICGVDEAGRGCLAGPVVAAAVVIDADSCQPLPDVADSKRLTPELREDLSPLIKASVVCWAIGVASWRFIDHHNIRQAALKAMKEAVGRLTSPPHLVLVDGRDMLDIPFRVIPLVKGDAKSYAVGAASILAKVTRDRIMLRYHRLFPQYRWDKNKGYPTKEHRLALQRFGHSPLHRRSFKWREVSSED